VGRIPPDRQAEYALNNYGVGMGDNFNLDFANRDPLMRGLFGFESAIKLAQIADGTSNTMAMAEILVAPAEPRLGRAIGNNTNNPLACRASLVNGEYVTGTLIIQTRCHGNRWQDGRPLYVGINNILPPNSATCSTQANSGIYSASSAHTGGVNILLADGAVRFVPQTIDTGNLSLAPAVEGPSPYGVWGALGSRNGGDIVGDY
jgi:prepilin-type processing-associated H-X9-DG protein